MPKTTLVFIGVLTVIAALLGYNYFVTPFYVEPEPEVEQQADLTSDLEQLLDPHKQVLNQLSPEQRISQVMAYPHTVGVLNDYLKEVSQAADAQTSDNSEDSESSPSASLENNQSSSSMGDSAVVNPILQLQDFQPGFITFFGSKIDYELAEKEIKELKQLFIDRRLQPLLAVDHEGGSVQRFSGKGFTTIPPWRQLCQDTQMNRQEVLLESAHELLQLDINIVFAPVVDLGSSVLGSRSCTDRRNMIAAARNYIDIFGTRNIMPVIKHYPGLGGSSYDLHDQRDSASLNPEEVEVFSNLLSLYPTIGVMTSHLEVEDYGQNLPCSLNPKCVSQISDRHLTTLIFSDALEMGAVRELLSADAEVNSQEVARQQATSSSEINGATDSEKNLENILDELGYQAPQDLDNLSLASYLAIMAGNHVLVYGEGVSYKELSSVRLALAQIYQEDEVFAQKVDRAVLKIINLKSI